MNIGVKFCGGCNPRYDRGEFYRNFLREHVEQHIETASPDALYDLLLVICGCPSACADISGLQYRRKLVIDDGSMPGDLQS